MKLIDVLENLEMDKELFDMEVRDDFSDVTLELFNKDIEKTIALKELFTKAMNNVYRKKRMSLNQFSLITNVY